jgi:hypothetical protein
MEDDSAGESPPGEPGCDDLPTEEPVRDPPAPPAVPALALHEPAAKRAGGRPARPEISPYLRKPFHRTSAGITSERVHRPAADPLPPLSPWFTKFDNRPPKKPRAGQPYLERVAYYENKEREFNWESAQRYGGRPQFDCYRANQQDNFMRAMHRSRKLQEAVEFERRHQTKKPTTRPPDA